MKRELEGEMLNKAIGALQGKNKAYIEGEIGHLKIDGAEIHLSGSKYRGEPIFESYAVDKTGKVNTPEAWSREFDTEYVMLSEIAFKLGAKKGEVYTQYHGEIKIVSELPYCISCRGVIHDFGKMFPNVNIVLIENLKY